MAKKAKTVAKKKPAVKAKAKPAVKAKKQKVFKLPAVLDIAFASKFVDQLGDVISRSSEEVVVDGSEVDRLTTPCVQILLCADAKLSIENGSLFVKSPSDVMVQVFTDLGLLDQLNKWRK